MTSQGDGDWTPADDRDESEGERLDRNWHELLQELRVTQTGTQILTGFLLTVAFQPTFKELTATQQGLYLVVVVIAVLTTILALAPVLLHRLLFRQGAKEAIVHLTDAILKAALVGTALVLAGTVLLIVGRLLGEFAGVLFGVGTLLVVTAIWSVLVPLARRRLRD